ncbi:hypothetical protein [Georgenia sp. SUBG003]|uniref:hypothetical protein n=1 Tax=Georgenia sp. SUBG003 TaxID=1497974 RepID=UPI0004D979B3|nr:hypothetical protein DA06_13505 [Georgenia sp. SUBG003]
MPPSALGRTFLVVAVVSGLVIGAAALLWVLEVIPLAVFLGVVVVMFVVESLVVLSAVRKAGRAASGRPVSAPPGPAGAEVHGASTVHEPGVDGVGYDPMERFRRRPD